MMIMHFITVNGSNLSSILFFPKKILPEKPFPEYNHVEFYKKGSMTSKTTSKFEVSWPGTDTQQFMLVFIQEAWNLVCKKQNSSSFYEGRMHVHFNRWPIKHSFAYGVMYGLHWKTNNWRRTSCDTVHPCYKRNHRR